jgi:uncharacterized protein
MFEIRILIFLAVLVAGWLSPSRVSAQEAKLPEAPARHFNDYAGLVSKGIAGKLDATLLQFERRTTNQLVVAIFPKLDSSLSLETYCLRVFNHWGVGQKSVNNGVAVFVFAKDHKMRIQVGRGLETVLPDSAAQQIVDQMAARFRNGDFDGGLSQGVLELISRLENGAPNPVQ